MERKQARGRAAGRIGGLVRSSLYDGRAVTAKARTAFEASFEAQVDPNRELPEAERKRRARAAYRAHMRRLAIKAVKARRTKAEARNKKAAGRPSSPAASEGVRTSDHLQRSA